MSHPWSVAAVAVVCLSTLVLGALGWRFARGTSDFYVAGRTVTPWRNASAIGGEYLSAASFLGVAGLVYDRGADMLWLPIGYTVGYLVLLLLIAAPLRRSGAYTLPDFAELRLGSRWVRLLCAAVVIAIGWLYLLPQLQGAGLALRYVSGAPTWVGALVVAVVITTNVVAGGMRSITLVQAVQYWIKLTAIAVPAFVLVALWVRDGQPAPEVERTWWEPLTSAGPDGHSLFVTYSTLAALCLGTMGLPHIAVRFYTNPDGRDARRTTVAVLALLGLFYLFPPIYGVLGRVYVATGTPEGSPENVVLSLPHAVMSGLGGDLLSALLAGGAFAAFLSTASGVAMSVAGALDQDVLRRPLSRLTGGDVTPVQSFRIAALAGVTVPFVVALVVNPVGVSTAVGHAFAIAAATFAPLLILGVWWRGLTPLGAGLGMVVGALTTTACAVVSLLGEASGWFAVLTASPTAWATPMTLGVMVGVSLLSSGQVPRRTAATMAQLHTPESVLAESSPPAARRR